MHVCMHVDQHNGVALTERQEFVGGLFTFVEFLFHEDMEDQHTKNVIQINV